MCVYRTKTYIHFEGHCLRRNIPWLKNITILTGSLDSVLLNKLECMGIKDQNLQWIRSSLINRYQRTICNNNLSFNIKCGVPQGSIPGPLFFLVYINDLKNIMHDIKYQLYADDTVLYCRGESFNDCVIELQNSLGKFVSLC